MLPKPLAFRALAIAGVCAALVGAVAIAFFSAGRDRTGAASFRGTPLEPPKIATDIALVDESGKPAHIVDRAFPVTFLFFGYTHCPDECPLAMASLGHAYRTLTPAQATKTRVIFVTVDPKRDSPAVLKRYLANFDAHFVGLTGPPGALEAAWQAYGVTVDARTHAIGHGDTISAIDGTGHVVLIYPPSVAAADLAADAAALIKGS